MATYYNTNKGPKTEAELRYELAAAGYPGPWDVQSMIYALNNANPMGRNDGSSGSSGIAGLYGSVVDSNQMDFDERVREFNAMLELKLRELGLSEAEVQARIRQADQQLYANVALGLLQGATSLRGPANWLEYAQFTGGGRDIFKGLYGDQPVAAFGSATGYSKAATLQDILTGLGIPEMPGTGLTDDQALDWIWNKRPDLATFFGSRGWPTQTAQQRRAIVREWISTTDPQYAGMTPQQVAKALGWVKPSPDATAAAAGTQAATQGQAATTATAGTGGAGVATQAVAPEGATTAAADEPAKPDKISQAIWDALTPDAKQLLAKMGYLVPNAHQVNPAVWDSYSDTAKQAVLDAAQNGLTPTGVMMPEDYLRQLNAARPKGIAPRQVGYTWGMKNSFF